MRGEQSLAVMEGGDGGGGWVWGVEENGKRAMERGEEGYVLATGRSVLEDEAAALVEHDELQKAYLGR